uniref:Uncharacterized protein n=1 Tax=Panagrolaimus sp. ES5 TaxID=591445 RepID=A0AC34GPU7_9BILA
MSHQASIRDHGGISSNPSSSTDHNKQCQPLSESSERNLQMLATMGYSTLPVKPVPVSNIGNSRKRKASWITTNKWYDNQFIEEINTINDFDGHFEALKQMDENEIHPMFKENLLLTYTFLIGEVGRQKRGHADQVITMERRLAIKNAQIMGLQKENALLNEKLDVSSKKLEEERVLQGKHIEYLEKAINIRDSENDMLLQQIHQTELENSENVAANLRRCEKLVLLMKSMKDVVIVKKKADEAKKPKDAKKPSSCLEF